MLVRMVLSTLLYWISLLLFVAGLPVVLYMGLAGFHNVALQLFLSVFGALFGYYIHGALVRLVSLLYILHFLSKE